MLKIKDNVNLKELEKYGFYKDEQLSDCMETIYSMRKEYQKICFDIENKIIYLYEPFNSNAFIIKTDIIYDLIKADLVEKVSDE